MKRISLLLCVMIWGLIASAQKLESTTDYYTGYLSTNNFDQANTIKSIDGVLYFIFDDIPVALLRYPAMKTDEEYEIPATVRRICNNAFQGTVFLKTLKIHNRITEGMYVNLTIGENAFNDSSIENFIVIENNTSANEDGAFQDSKSNPKNRTEIARYDISGRRVNEDTEGVQIVVYDDNDAEKIYNKKK